MEYYDKNLNIFSSIDNNIEIVTSPSPMLPDYDDSDFDEALIMQNEIKWNTWMNVLARCPRCEEEDVLEQLEQLNMEYRELMG